MKKSSWWLLGGVLILLGVMIFVSCFHNTKEREDHGVEYPIPENAIITINNAYLIKKDGVPLKVDGGIWVNISFQAGVYYLPKDIKDLEKYLKLLDRKREEQTNNILKLTIDGNKIIKIERVTQKEKKIVLNQKRAPLSIPTIPKIQKTIPGIVFCSSIPAIIDRTTLYQKNGKVKATNHRLGVEIEMGLGWAARYYLPTDISKFEEYVKLLLHDIENNYLKLTIGEGTVDGYPIIKVEYPSKEEKKRVSEVYTSREKRNDIPLVKPEKISKKIPFDMSNKRR